jgi:hypothetical protein
MSPSLPKAAFTSALRSVCLWLMRRDAKLLATSLDNLASVPLLYSLGIKDSHAQVSIASAATFVSSPQRPAILKGSAMVWTMVT